MRLERFHDLPTRLGGIDVPRRTMIRGGLGLVMGAVVGGLEDDLDHYALDEPAAADTEAEAAPADTEAEEPTQDEGDQAESEDQEEPEAAPTEFRLGMNGDEVEALQDKLNATGYWCGTPDGGFGHLTQQAVFAVQKANGLARDGIAGPDTLRALASGHLPSPVAGGNHMEVHLGPQLLLVVRGGATSMVLNTSTGNGQPYTFEGGNYVAHTPTGDFSVWYTDGSGWRDGELGELYRPMFYDGNYAIHGSGSIPPWPASHGCARISTTAMDMFWSEGLLSMGDRVIVV